MKIYTQLLLFGLMLFSLNLQAQEVKTNADGDQIVVYPDGTWRYLEPGEVIPTQTEKESSGEEDSKLSPKEKDAEFEARILALRAAEKKEEFAEKKRKELFTIGEKRKNLEASLQELRDSESRYPEQEEILERRVLKARDNEKETKAAVNAAEKEAAFYMELVYMNQKKREKALAKYEETASLAVEKESKKPEVVKTGNTGSVDRPQRTYVKYKPSQDVILNPPKYRCNIAVDETDEFTGQRRRTTATELLFTHTREEIRPYYKDREHTTCHANITAMGGGIYVLSIEIAIASRTAQQEYGGLLANGTLMVVLLDGSTITMNNNRTDRGLYDAVRDVYVFKGNYQIPPKQVKDLQEGEADKIRVVWEQGYDTYDIYELDFLRNHLNCLVD